MYAALYFTDVEGDPLALRSALGVETWQFLGGNVEHGDANPFATAVRECEEETGIEFDGSPVLLLTHFIPAHPGWPCPKIGFVFDGGILTASELGQIVLDPSEHTDWLVQSIGAWKTTLSPRPFTRIAAAHDARTKRSATLLCEPPPTVMNR